MKNIRWEKEDQRQPGRPNQRGNAGSRWYRCLLVYIGTLLCVISAYRQLTQIMPGVRTLHMPQYTWRAVLLMTAVFAVLYGGERLGYLWMKCIPILCYLCGFAVYYIRHRIDLEDGGLYLVRCYLRAVNRYYGTQIIFRGGVRSEAGGTLLFWMLAWIGLAVFAAAVIRRMESIAVLPGLILIAGIVVGNIPDSRSLFALAAGVIVLRMHRSASAAEDRIHVHLGQLAAVLCICMITCVLAAPLADRVVTQHDVVYERQLALEDALLALPVNELFAKNGQVTNNAPSGSRQEILTISLSDQATENVYLRDFAARSYRDGTWYADTDGFAEQAGENGMSTQEAGAHLSQSNYTDAKSTLLSRLSTDILYESRISQPEDREFTIRCRHWGQVAPVPALSALPSSLVWKDDAVVQKDWTQKQYSGTLIMGGDAKNRLQDYLAAYYLTRVFLPYLEGVSIRDLIRDDAQTGSDEDRWYKDYVADAYTSEQMMPEAEELLNAYFAEGRYEGSALDADALRAAADAYEQGGTADQINYTRISYALIIQQYLRQFGTYDTRLDPLPAGTDPVAYFLGTSEKGFCVHYASAGTMMLQALGIPSRYATGYVAFAADFTENKTDQTWDAIVRGERAHAWTEVYLEDIGWIPVEMTPGFDEEKAPDTDASESDAASQNGQQDESSPGTDQTPEDPSATAEEPAQSAQEQNTPGITSNDLWGRVLDQTWCGVSLRLWLLSVLIVILLLSALIMARQLSKKREARMTGRIQCMIRQGEYTQAVRLVNHRIYLMAAGRELVHFRQIRDDSAYRHALTGFFERYGMDIDTDQYMRIVRTARFSDNGSTAEDARIVYDIYDQCLHCRKQRRH